MKLKRFFIFLILSVFLVTACSADSSEIVPYAIEGEIEMDESSELYDFAGLNMTFYNRSEKTVEEMTIVFYMFDSNGEPISIGKGNITLHVKATVESKEFENMRVSLDPFFYVIPDDVYTIDYLYVSKINYTDGSVWSDPFGILYF